MGENVAGSRTPPPERPSLAGALLVHSFDVIASFYELKHEADYHELTEYLVGLSCRDQDDEDTIDELSSLGDIGLAGRRAEGYKQAKALRDHAKRVLKSIDAIDDGLRLFDAAVQFNPPLLEAIFDVDTGDPRNLTVPAEIAILLTFFQETEWETAAAALRRLSELPVRKRLTRGPVKNETLRRAVAACRDYWRDVEGHSWSMSSLKVKNVRDLNNARNLQGKCEAFVSDLLSLCGISHGLHDLASAWSAVDKA